ncbi:TTL-domain-containing protein [Pseudovirgaria hyperparasitica]|uniref:TTL-domain-containing protein n=1 Tax=Pseudovirgaria hyperparasitica TaxID=470096 RepID=A0A6A6WF17_9PEZI|nr:TTL-domain-containing protein [Pseudovirgaria hyperparasitica]KAF2761418.1 TTL-domain-containing protein [Pseudovirgaria hyperparasitica]
MNFSAIIDYDDDYIQPLIISSLQKRLPSSTFELKDSIDTCTPASAVLQFRDYESIDFQHAVSNPQSLVNAYIIRKALIRKHYLSNTVSNWITKHPETPLKGHVKASVDFELDYAEFLDDALVEAFELRESFEKNEGKEPQDREWWILKPGMSDRGQGIRLFSTEEELQEIFEEWEAENPSDSDDDGETSDTEDARNHEREGDGIITSHLRHFVAQPYIHPPLLLEPSITDHGPRKFHIRTYVLAVGALKVYVHKPMLALFAAQPYSPPWEADSADALRAHLTNTCLQGSDIREGSVNQFWSLTRPQNAPEDWKDAVWSQICDTTGALFEAAARGMMIHFQPIPNAFEMFGLDFMVDEDLNTWLLEVNAFPDFKQTGDDLKGIVEGFFEDVVDLAIKPFFGLGKAAVGGNERSKQVLDIDLGRR